MQEAQAALQAKDADLAMLRAELASLKEATPRAGGASATTALRYNQRTPGYPPVSITSITIWKWLRHLLNLPGHNDRQ